MGMESLNDIWDEPEIFKGIKLYPIKMRNVMLFYSYIWVLTINKKECNDIKLIKMNYLDFLFHLGKTKEEQEQTIYTLYFILQMVLQGQKFDFVEIENQKIICKVQVSNKENTEEEWVEINGKEFEEMRIIILKQNGMKLDDDLIDAEVKRELEEAQAFLNKRNKSKSATMREMIGSYHASLGFLYKDIKELTISQFYLGIERKSTEFYSNMLGQAWSQGNVKNEDLISWLSHNDEKDKYDDVISDESEIKKLQGKLEG